MSCCHWKFVLIQLHYKGQCWCDFSTNEVLTRCHGKDECWRGLSVNEVLTWLHVEKASLKKTSANIALVDKVIVILQCKCKCWRSFLTKISGDTILMQRKKYRCSFIVKAGVNMASVQGQMLMWLYCKDFWCDYVAKTLDVATLQRSLIWLHCKDS